MTTVSGSSPVFRLICAASGRNPCAVPVRGCNFSSRITVGSLPRRVHGGGTLVTSLKAC